MSIIRTKVTIATVKAGMAGSESTQVRRSIRLHCGFAAPWRQPAPRLGISDARPRRPVQQRFAWVGYIVDHAHHIPHGFIPSWQITMPSTDAFALRRSGLNEFLFAPVGIEANGMTLSLLSVFARAGSDPWAEAGRLAGLPKSEATASLARSIAGMPASIWPLQVAMTIADRLVALLPTQSYGARPRLAVPVVAGKAGRFISMAILLIYVACMLAVQAGLFTTSAPPNPGGSDVASFTASPDSPSDVRNSPSPSPPAPSSAR